ncbi:MAG: hypothetical protein Q8K91_12825 [Hylemonella sp.]|nr:hypothetical protein [Hylemonella sp.]MDP1938082.1 hypothetical protein [Hylemonella sp.]
MSGNLKLAFVIEALDKATGPLSRIGRSIDKIGEPIRRIGSLSAETAFRFGRFMGNRLQNQMGEVRERFGKVRDTAEGLAQTFGAVSLAAGGVFWALKRTIDETDRASDVSKKLGITVEMYQRLGYAAQLNGSDQETMGQSLQFLSQNMVEAINGSKEAAVWFQRVGIPLNQLKKMNVVEVFEKISDKFLKVGDAGQNAEKKIAVMKALMGRSGADLKQVLDLGSEGLKNFYTEADKMGAVVSGQTADAMGDFNDNFDRMKFSIFGVMSSIAQHALPALDGLVQRITSMSVESRADWGKSIGDTITKIVDALPGFLTATGQIISALAMLGAVANVVAQFLGWDNVLTALAVVMGAKLAFSIYGLGKAIVTMIPTIWSLGVALMSTPLGWFMAAIAAIIGLVVLIYKNWEPIKQFFADLWGGIKTAFTSVYDWIMGKIMAVVELAAKVGQAVKGIFSGDTGGSASFDAMGNATGVDAMSALPAGRGQKSDVGGTIRLQIDQDGRARVAEVKKNNPGVDFDVYSGMSMATP